MIEEEGEESTSTTQKNSNFVREDRITAMPPSMLILVYF
jgi:hypothetical protein